MRRAERWIAWLIAAGLAALVSACAGVPRDASLPIDDPNEQFNRGVLHVNQVVLDPVANVVKTVPAPMLNRLRDLDANLKEPRIFANNILQGRFAAAASRSTASSSIRPSASAACSTSRRKAGCRKQSGDFGQTMFVWGVPAGPYVVPPYYGPSTQRDSVGGAVDTVGDPVGWVMGGLIIGWPWSVGAGGVSAMAHLGQWKQAENASIDFYSFLRSDYYQTRRAELREALGLPPGVESPATPGPIAGSPATVRPVTGSPGYEIPPPQ